MVTMEAKIIHNNENIGLMQNGKEQRRGKTEEPITTTTLDCYFVKKKISY
jgi:hypothetical protein